MKLITFVVPSYNSENYLHICLDSLVKGGDRIEVLVIDDGSSDSTLEIAKSYEAKYPNIVRAIHQENKGHGGAINTGLNAAKGIYFKVVDSDDWVNEKALLEMIKAVEEDSSVDLIIANYVYYYGYETITKVIDFKKVLKPKVKSTWKDFKRLRLHENLTLHSCMYKTEILKNNHITLPEKCFYEDNYMVYAPLPHTQTLYYLNEDFYCYLIGREGQSVSKDISLKRYKNYQTVASLVFNELNIYDYKDNKNLFKCLFHHLRLNFMITTLFTRLNNDKQIEKEFFSYLKELKKKNKKQYIRLRYFSLYAPLAIPSFIGRLLDKIIYFISHKVVKFN